MGWGGAKKNIDFLDSSWNVWHLKCLPIKLPTPGGVGLIFVYYFSLQFMTFPGLLIFWPPKIPTATPFGGGGGFFLSIFSTVHEIYRTFEILTPNGNPPGWDG